MDEPPGVGHIMRMRHRTTRDSALGIGGSVHAARRWHAAPGSLRTLAAATLCVCLAAAGKAGPLARTFSRVGRGAAPGGIGVAVQSRWFSVGSIVTWAEAGVGA